MTSSLRSKKSGFSLRNNFCCLIVSLIGSNLSAQDLAAFHDNQQRFFIFDHGRIIQAEYLPVNDYSVGGTCVLYADNRNHLKMYFDGEITTLEINKVSRFEALDYLSVYSLGGIVKIVENGKVTTISTYSMQYLAEDSLVAFYDSRQQVLAVYYQGAVRVLEDGLAGKPYSNFRAGDNLVSWISTRTNELKLFYQGESIAIEPFLSGGSYKAGRDILAFINQADQKFKVFDKGEVFEVEEFPPQAWVVGDELVTYLDNTGSFKVFKDGVVTELSAFRPDFYKVVNQMVVFGEQGYFKVWYDGNIYTLENFIPSLWKAQWNTIVYKDLSNTIKVFNRGETRVLTYDLVQDVELYRDLVLVNKGMNNYNIYYKGKKY
jgi:hypothetical protein